MALGAIAGGLLGAIAGGQGSNSSSSSEGGIRVAPETALEQYANPMLQRQLQEQENFANLGPGAQDITAGVGAQRSLADMLQQYSTGGFMPSQQDYASAGQFADATLGASFRQQETQAARLSAQLGRPVNDPILQAKLRQSLGEQRGSMVAQEARNMPMQRLQFASGLADVRSGLATQAMSNRQALMSLGSQLRGQDREWRLQTGTRWGTQSQSGGGGLAGAISGGLAGVGMGAKIGGLMSAFGGSGAAGGGGGMPSSNDWSALMRSPGNSVPGGLGTSSFDQMGMSGNFGASPAQINAADPTLQRMLQQNRGGPVSQQQPNMNVRGTGQTWGGY